MNMKDTYRTRLQQFNNSLRVNIEPTHLHPNVNVGLDSEQQLSRYVYKIDKIMSSNNKIQEAINTKA